MVSREVKLARPVNIGTVDIRTVDIGTVAALTWIVVAIGITVLIGPQLGLRGWAWLGLHHLLCVIGTSHELWRARKRRLARREGATPGNAD